jgi:hypothetical protein
MFGRVGKVVWRHPWATALVLAFLILVAAGVSLPCYALQQWHAAQADVKEGRYTDAQRRLGVCLFSGGQGCREVRGDPRPHACGTLLSTPPGWPGSSRPGLRCGQHRGMFDGTEKP